MRRLVFTGLALALGSSALAGIGCRSAVADFYEDLLTATGTGGTGGTGGSGGLPDECQGDPTQDPGLVRDGCGVFVDAAAPTNGDGTKATPFKTVLAAAQTSKARIFVCSGDYAEDATVELSNGVSIYGGFGACPKDGDWVWDAQARAKVTGPANVPAVRVSMGASHIEGFDITAPPATSPGQSSIALVADGADLELVSVSLTAGSGVDGADGLVPDTVAADGADGMPSTASAACAGNISGGLPGVTMCTDGETAGGSGGEGGTVPANNGQPGANGTPLPDPNPGNDGFGGAVDAAGVCDDGEKGKLGDAGRAGDGATDKGTLTSSGVAGGDGTDGEPGKPGQGGGGGAGSKAGNFCPPATAAGAGASGGGGGAGGCGGKGGSGGKGGGSSIGIVSVDSTLTFSGVSVTTAAGGAGGDGALGKAGGKGGNGADGGSGSGLGTSQDGCRGGNGGNGGNGGQGGGGRGGHSVGIAFKGGTAPSIAEGISFDLGSPGTGGLGDELSPGGHGAPGATGEAVDFGG